MIKMLIKYMYSIYVNTRGQDKFPNTEIILYYGFLFFFCVCVCVCVCVRVCMWLLIYGYRPFGKGLWF